MNTKKITFVISSLSSGGAERVVCSLANEMVKSTSVSIITYYEVEPFYKIDSNVRILNCIDKAPKKFNPLTSIINNTSLLFKLIKLLRKEKTDICISFMTTSNILSVAASRFIKIPCIISERIHPGFMPINKFWDFLRKTTYPKAAKLVIQTEDIKHYFEAFVPSSQLVIIKNPISPELAKKRTPGAKREQFILNVGRLEAQKNQGMLIDAFHSLKLTDWKLVLIGDGSLKRNYNKKVSELNIDKQVEFVSHVKNIHDYYNKASIFVFTSDFEGFPNALTEALYFGTPSISTDCPTGPSELIDNGGNGFLIPVRDTEALKLKLKTLINDEALKNKFSKNAIKSTEVYNIENITKQWQQLINKVLQ